MSWPSVVYRPNCPPPDTTYSLHTRPAPWGRVKRFAPGDVRGMEALAYASLFQVSTAIFQPSRCRCQTTT
jgi:hypothetical protein